MELEKIIAKTCDLPSLPTVAARINAEMNNESLTAKNLGKILSEDSSLVAKILRLSNSAFYGMPKQVASIEKAVMILGFNAVKNLALGVSVYSFFEVEEECSINVKGLWNHSLATAGASRSLMAKSNKKLADEAFLFGIIHDIGKVIMINASYSDMERVLTIAAEREICQTEAEQEVFGFTHQKVGAALLREWRFPDPMIFCVLLHQNIPPEVKKIDQNSAQIIQAVCIANQMVKALGLGESTNKKRETIPASMWKMLAIKREDLPDLSQEIKENYSDMLAAWEDNN